MKILVMWSGGIDSTYTLAKLLSETDYEIHAHHIYLVNHEQRHVAENKAIKNLLPKLKEIRDFTFSESMIDHSKLPLYPFDMAIVCSEAGVVMRAHKIHQDLTAFDRWTIGTHLSEGHWEERFSVILGCTRGMYWGPSFGEPPPFELQPMVTKYEEMNYLGNINLLQDCWYCRTPRGKDVCGACKSCAEVSKTMIENLPKGIING
jgi:hypothetical protein